MKEGEKNSACLYLFYKNFGRSHRFIRGLIHQEYNGHYYRINQGTKIINGRVTFPSTVQQVLETINGKIYYNGRQVVLPEPEFANDNRQVIITNLSEIASLPSTHIRSSRSTLSEVSSFGILERPKKRPKKSSPDDPLVVPPNYSSLDPVVESLLQLKNN